MLNIRNASTAPAKRNSQWECKKTHGEGKSNSSSCQQQRADPVWSCIYLYDTVSTTSNWPWGTATAKLKPQLLQNDVFRKRISGVKTFQSTLYGWICILYCWKTLSSFFWWTSITDPKQLVTSSLRMQLHMKHVISCMMKCGLETRPACQGFVPAKSLLACDRHNPHQTKNLPLQVNNVIKPCAEVAWRPL